MSTNLGFPPKFLFAMLLLWASAFAAVDLTTGLAGFWKFDGSTNDASGNSNWATLVNAPTYGTGTNGQCLVPATNGASPRYANLGHGPMLTNISNQLTVAAWVKYAGSNMMAGANRSTILSRFSPVNVFLFDIIEPPGQLRMILYTNGGSVNLNSATTFPTNVWVHVAAVYDGVKSVVYTNGLTNFSGPATGPLAGSLTTDLLVAARGDNLSTYVWGGGGIDEVCMYNRALNQSEIQALMLGLSVGITNLASNQAVVPSTVVRGSFAATGGQSGSWLLISNATPAEAARVVLATNALGGWTAAMPALTPGNYTACALISNTTGAGFASAAFPFTFYNVCTLTVKTVSRSGSPWAGGRVFGPPTSSPWDGVRTNDAQGLATFANLLSGVAVGLTNFSPQIWGMPAVSSNFPMPSTNATLVWVLDPAAVPAASNTATLSNAAAFVAGRSASLRLEIDTERLNHPRVTISVMPLSGGKRTLLYDQYDTSGGTAVIEIPAADLERALSPGAWVIETSLLAPGQDKGRAVVRRRLLFFGR